MVAERRPRISIFVFAEDRSDESLVALIKAVLRDIDPSCRVDEQVIDFQRPEREYRDLARGNAYKGASHDRLVRLHNYILGILAQDLGFVVFHADGDRIYEHRHTSENVAKYERRIRAPIASILEDTDLRSRPRRRERRAPPPTPTISVQERLAKLFLFAPFYSIEAWLYQNTELAARLCRENASCTHKCIERLNQWRTDRGALDEVDKPKQLLCFQDKHNAALASAGYPIAAVIAAGKSLHDAVRPMRECAALLSALARTHEQPATH